MRNALSATVLLLVVSLSSTGARADAVLDVDLIVCEDFSLKIPLGFRKTRVTVATADGVVLQQSPNVNVFYDDMCSAKFPLELETATLDALTVEELTIKLETCYSSSCTFAAGTSVKWTPGALPL